LEYNKTFGTDFEKNIGNRDFNVINCHRSYLGEAAQKIVTPPFETRKKKGIRNNRKLRYSGKSVPDHAMVLDKKKENPDHGKETYVEFVWMGDFISKESESSSQ